MGCSPNRSRCISTQKCRRETAGLVWVKRSLPLIALRARHLNWAFLPFAAASVFASCKNSSRADSFWFASDTQSIRYAIDVVKPRRDQGNLQDSAIVKANGAQFFVILGAALRG